MAEAWRIARSSRNCAATGAAIPTGEPFYSALVDKDDSFERVDYSAIAWPEVDKESFFSYWKNKGGAETEDKAPPVDYDRLLSFFDSLEGATEAPRRLLRYVLALVLARRRRLRLDDMGRTGDGDRLVVFDRRSGKTLEIVSPEATREELEKAQEKLNQLFECDLAGD